MREHEHNRDVAACNAYRTLSNVRDVRQVARRRTAPRIDAPDDHPLVRGAAVALARGRGRTMSPNEVADRLDALADRLEALADQSEKTGLVDLTHWRVTMSALEEIPTNLRESEAAQLAETARGVAELAARLDAAVRDVHTHLSDPSPGDIIGDVVELRDVARELRILGTGG